MVNFTKPKFLSLSSPQQHRHLATLLRAVHTDACKSSWNIYEELINYLQIEIPAGVVEDKYHFHLKMAGRQHKEHHLLPKKNITDRETPASPALPVDIYLDNLRSAHNVGSIARSTEAFGLGTLYGSGLTPPPSPKTAMGAEKWIRYQSITLDQIKSPIIAIEIIPEAVPYNHFSYPNEFTLAVGNEERGCSKEVLSAASQVICIPMYGRKNSLNVANAFAIIAADIASRHPLRRSVL